MKKLTTIALTAIIASSLIFVSPAFAGRGQGNGGGGGGGGGVCQNLVTTWTVDPDKNTMAAGQAGVYTLNVTNNCANAQDVKLSTTDAGMTFDPASFSLKSGEKTQVKVKVTMPAQNGRNEVWFTIKFACSVGNGKVVKFRIRYTNQVCCNFVASWVTNPNGKTADSLTAYTFPLDLTNKCSDKITFTLESSHPVMKFSRNNFSVDPGTAGRVNVIVGAHNKKITGKITFKVTIRPACGAVKILTFTLVYK